MACHLFFLRGFISCGNEVNNNILLSALYLSIRFIRLYHDGTVLVVKDKVGAGKQIWGKFLLGTVEHLSLFMTSSVNFKSLELFCSLSKSYVDGKKRQSLSSTT